MFYISNINMKYKVEKYISKHKLLNPGSKVLVALSGGADSVALLLVLKSLGYNCEAVHCNFHLRGEESNRDEEFAKQLCERTGTKVKTVHFDTAAYSKEHGISIEMAAREQRYKAFEEQRARIGAHAIAVAHHRDDSAETLLLNLIRGTGIRGLRGIQPKNGYIIRPLLCVCRDDITEYLKWRNEGYVTDSTNLAADYTRNKIRLEIIPKLAEINPSVLDSIASTAQRISEAELIYRNAIEEAIKRVKKDNRISIQLLKKEIAPSTLLHEIIAPLGFNSTHVANIMESLDTEGSRESSNGKWRIIKEQEHLAILPQKPVAVCSVTLPATGTVIAPGGILHISTGLFDGNIPKSKNCAILDCSKIKMPLRLRNIAAGDRFTPFGMKGSKLISDYLTDCKKSKAEKEQQLVVTDASGTIAWLVGERPSAQFRITASTKEVVIIEWENENPELQINSDSDN